MSRFVKRIDINTDAIDYTKIDFGTSGTKVNAASLPVVGLGSVIDSSNVNDAIFELANKNIGVWNQVDNVAMFGNYLDVTDYIENTTPKVSFEEGTGTYVDAIGNYNDGVDLPLTTTNVTQYGKPGYCKIVDANTKDVIDNIEGHEIYGIMYYDLDTNKFFLCFYTEIIGLGQTKVDVFVSQNINFTYTEVFAFNRLPADALCRSGFVGFTDSSNVISLIDTAAGLGDFLNKIQVKLEDDGILNFNTSGEITCEHGSITAEYINFGLDANMVSASIIPIEDAGDYFTIKNVESALQELAPLILPLGNQEITLDNTDISNGYKLLSSKISGPAGEKKSVTVTYVGCGALYYGRDFTLMNNDLNDASYIIFKASATISGINTIVCPSAGIDYLLINGDKINIIYQ
jgi:hypothetical protein